MGNWKIGSGNREVEQSQTLIMDEPTKVGKARNSQDASLVTLSYLRRAARVELAALDRACCPSGQTGQ